MKRKKIAAVAALCLAALLLLAVSAPAVGDLLRLSFGSSSSGSTGGGAKTGTDLPFRTLGAYPLPNPFPAPRIATGPGAGILGSNALALSTWLPSDDPSGRPFAWPDAPFPRPLDLPRPAWLSHASSHLDWRPEAGPPLPGFVSLGSPTSGEREALPPTSPPPTIPTPVPGTLWLLGSGLALAVRFRGRG